MTLRRYQPKHPALLTAVTPACAWNSAENQPFSLGSASFVAVEGDT
jgi:hypothetical protein